jgi:chromosome segregation ATPase
MKVYKVLSLVSLITLIGVCYLYFTSMSELNSKIDEREKNINIGKSKIDSLSDEIKIVKLELSNSIKETEKKYKYELANFEKFKLESKFKYQKLSLDKDKLEDKLNQEISDISSKYDDLLDKNNKNKKEITDLKKQNESCNNSLMVSKNSTSLLSAENDALKSENELLVNKMSNMVEKPIDETVEQPIVTDDDTDDKSKKKKRKN